MGCGCQNRYSDVAPVVGGYYFYPGDCAPEIAAAKDKLAKRYREYRRTPGDCHDASTAAFVARFRAEKGIYADITSAAGSVDPEMLGVVSAEVNKALGDSGPNPFLFAILGIVAAKAVGVI